MDHSDQTPLNCFKLEELDDLRSAEGRTLRSVNYYLIDHKTPLLFYLELLFDDLGDALLITCGDDSLSMRTAQAEDLLRDAERLRLMHGKTMIKRLSADTSAVWTPRIGRLLRQVKLSRNEEGLFLNDACCLDFGDQGSVLVHLGRQEGLQLSVQSAT